MNSITDFIVQNLTSIWALVISSWVLSSFVLVSLLVLVINLIRNTYNKQ